MQKLAKLIIKTNSKLCEPKTYSKAVKNLINGKKWQKTIDKNL